MPTYEYVCQKCGHHFEKFHSISAKPLATCPKDLCGQKRWGKGKVKKMISAGAGLLFKGSGFYITDYRDKSYTDKAKAESGNGSVESEGAEKSDAKTSETKSDSNAESTPKGEAKADKPAKSEPKSSKKK